MARLAKLWASVRQGPAPLSHKQAVALAGDVYRHLVETCSDDPGSADSWSAVKGWGRAVVEGRIEAPPTLELDPRGSNEVALARDVFGVDLTAGIDAEDKVDDLAQAMEARYGVVTSWTLMRRGLEVDPETRNQLLAAVHAAVTDACHFLKRNAAGDYTPDVKAARFPVYESAKPSMTVQTLFDRWAAETKPAGSTTTTTRGIVASLARHVLERPRCPSSYMPV